MSARGVAAGIAGGAAVIAVVSLIARVVGFGRQLVFQGSVGDTTLGSVYVSANFVPAILFEIVAGGALAGVVVPLVVGAVERGDRAQVRQTTAALLGWALLVLVPVAALAAALAGPISGFVLSGVGESGEAREMAARMLRIFLFQLPLYGIAAVTAGVMHAHRRFLAPALAPIMSSAVVVATYLVFRTLFTGDRQDLGTVPLWAELLLAGGTTLGAAALALTTLVPLYVIGVRVVPRLRFPAGQRSRAMRLAAAGLAMVAAQQIVMLLLIPIVNSYGGDGRLVTYQNTWMVYLLPYAVLAVPIATSSFPALAGHAARGDRRAWAFTTLSSTRAVTIAAGLGAAALVAAAGPIAAAFDLLSGAGTVPRVEMARALVAFAPGLFGFCLVFHLNRALLAAGRPKTVGVASTVGWGVALLVSVAVAATVPQGWVVAAVGIGHTAGMAVCAGILLAAVRRGSAGAGWRALARAGLAAVLAGAAGGVAGALVASAVAGTGAAATVGTGLVAGLVAAAAYVAVVAAVDLPDVRAVLARRRSP